LRSAKEGGHHTTAELIAVLRKRRAQHSPRHDRQPGVAGNGRRRAAQLPQCRRQNYLEAGKQVWRRFGAEAGERSAICKKVSRQDGSSTSSRDPECGGGSADAVVRAIAEGSKQYRVISQRGGEKSRRGRRWRIDTLPGGRRRRSSWGWERWRMVVVGRIQ